MVSYFSNEIKGEDYHLENNLLVNGHDRIDVIWFNKEDIISVAKEHKIKHKYVEDVNLIIFEYDNSNDLFKYMEILNMGYKKVIVINKNNCVFY